MLVLAKADAKTAQGDVYMSLGKVIRKYRKLKNLTQEECIFLCGSTAVPEERKPPVRWKETVKPEQGYRT